MVNMQPRANLSSVGRQPFRPGQWMGFRGVSKNTTYVQNNFFGGAYGGYYDSALNYNTTSCCDGGGMSKGMKWLMGLGVGSTLLGGILSLFKKDDAGEAGGPPVTTSSDQIADLQKQIEELQKRIKDMNTPTPPTKPGGGKVDEPPAEPAPTPTADPAPEEDPFKDFGKNGLVCRDASGKTRNITGAAGQVTVTKAGTAGGPPKEFTITDTTENAGGNTYTYELTGTTADGKPLYTCTSKNGQKISQGNQYTYDNGELVQYSNQGGYGSGLKTDAQISSQSSVGMGSPGSGVATPTNDPVESIMSTVSTNSALTPERKTEIIKLADSIQNSNLDDATKTELLNQLNTASLGIMLVDDTNFLKTKQTIEAEINAAGAKPSSTTSNQPTKTNYNASNIGDALVQQSGGKLRRVEVKQNSDGSYTIQGYYKGNGILKTNMNSIRVTDLNDPNIYNNLMEDYDSYFN